MGSIWNASARAALLERLNRMAPDRKPHWGRMSPIQTLKHLREPMRAAMGEIKVSGKNTPLRFTPLKQLVIYVLPWPKGVRTAPEFVITETADWAFELAETKAALDRMATLGRDHAYVPHPAFGRLSGSALGALVHRHWDHHLKQFGL
jgi:hypothetical protein